jgi:small conductance mechanosensitive channel
MKIFSIVAIVVGAHLTVIFIRRFGKRLMHAWPRPSLSKVRSLASLFTSITIFAVYFAAFGLVLKEFGVSLTAYLASASVMGLAIGFGSQGLVQDVVTGLTLIFSNLFDVGDMVEISSQTGIVRSIGMRFTILENYFGAEIFIPNRTITNVVNYPRGYIRCLLDITLSPDSDLANRMEKAITPVVSSAFEQFPGILLTPPSVEGRIKTSSGKEFLRVKFRIWPGRGTTIETTLKQEIVQLLKGIDPTYGEWMVTVNYEVEKKSVPLPSGLIKKRTKI